MRTRPYDLAALFKRAPVPCGDVGFLACLRLSLDGVRAQLARPNHSLSMIAIGCRRRGHELIPLETHDVMECWCGAHRYTGMLIARQPWLAQPGWQVAVGTRTPRIFRVRQALAHIFSNH